MKIAYVYNNKIGMHHYGKKHPMKPHRIALTNSLVHSYNLDRKMDIIQPAPCELYTYHSPEYINEIQNYSKSDDCPCFPEMVQYNKEIIKSTITAAKILPSYDCVINWNGGMHHARRESPSGFCYVNDIVMCITELLNSYKRILYVDIDIHHGDGVEEAFYNYNNVMTLSFHKYGDGYYPGTGCLSQGNYNFKKEGIRALNVPLKTGIDDWSYKYVFESITHNVVRKFAPEAIVMQCGADSIAEDRLGCFNLSINGHGNAVRFIGSMNIPFILLGGGGYNIRNVARAWSNETAIICGERLNEEIPHDNVYREYFGPYYTIHPIFKAKYENENSTPYLNNIISYVCNLTDYF